VTTMALASIATLDRDSHNQLVATRPGGTHPPTGTRSLARAVEEGEIRPTAQRSRPRPGGVANRLHHFEDVEALREWRST